MKIRAAIFDVYATLMEVGPPPADAEAQWQKLCHELPGVDPHLTRTEFAAHTGRVIARRHAEARARGIPWPEIQWPAVVREILPALDQLSREQRDEFLFRQMQLGRTVRLNNSVAETLRRLRALNCVLGIASNAQAYTLRELDTALRGAGLDLSIFDPELSVWSFRNGFSKPDPHVFQILTARLEALDILPADTLMVGDRLDNDIEPARRHGWQTWQVTKLRTAEGRTSGTFRQLLAALT